MSVEPSTRRRLSAVLSGAQSSTRTPTLVAGLAEGTDLVWAGSSGPLPAGVPEIDLAFRIGSITKTFTAVLLMRLVAEGSVELDDRTRCTCAGRICSNLPWRGLDEYYAGEVLTLPADGQALGAVLDIGSFCFTTRPYDSEAEVPGGGSDWTNERVQVAQEEDRRSGSSIV
jgi:Beta-lactamase